MDIHIPPSLEDLCFDVVFKELIATMNQSYDQIQEEVSVFSQLTDEELVTLIRGHLDQHLVGKVSREVRGKFVKRFYDILPSLKGEEEIAAWLFLDAVLDTTCTKLDVHLPVYASPCPKLIPTVVKRSPLLEELTINFLPTNRPAFFPAHADRDYQSLSCSIKEMEDVILPLCSLQRLTHLSLHKLFDRNVRLAALCLIGKACPSLTHLTVSDCGDKKDVLALILGESGIILLDSEKSHGGQSPRWCEDEVLDHLLVPSKHLSPICFTLRELKFGGENRIGASEIAFALRYLPLLEVIDGVFPASSAVFRLHQNVGNAIDQGKSLKLFNKAYRRSLPKNVANPRKRSRRKSIPTFSGQLLLTKLDYIDLKTEKLRAIGAMCPKLKEVTFMCYGGNIDIEVIKSILGGWPKLSSIRFFLVRRDLVTPVLEVFGPELKQLEVDCNNVKLTDLALCSKLESLNLLKTNLWMEPPNEIDPATFLPNLKSFKSEICLGTYSCLFEEKSTLVRLVLYCSHVAINHTLKIRRGLELDRIHQMWSQLEVLSIRGFAQLSMPDISELIPRLLCLKLVILPLQVEMLDRALFNSVRDHLLGRSPPAKISFSEVDIERAKKVPKCKIVELPNQ